VIDSLIFFIRKCIVLQIDSLDMNEHIKWMEIALREAEKSLNSDDIPVGAVIIKDGKIIGRGFNQVELLKDSTAHAEMIALTSAFNSIGLKWLKRCSMYVTLEPCSMCAGALVLSRIENLIIGADDPKTGACGSIINIVGHSKLNHKVSVKRGVLKEKCGSLLSEFFIRLRDKEK